MQAVTLPEQGRRNVVFENIGQVGVTVVGPVSRRSYSFDRSGARATVDARDHQALARLPMLKRM